MPEKIYSTFFSSCLMLQSLLNSSCSSLTWQEKSSTSHGEKNNPPSPCERPQASLQPQNCRAESSLGSSAWVNPDIPGTVAPVGTEDRALWHPHCSAHEQNIQQNSSPLLCSFLHAAERLRSPALQRAQPYLIKSQLRQKLQAGK